MKSDFVAGGIASSYATKTWLVANRPDRPSTPTVQRPQTSSGNSYRASSVARTFASARKPSQSLKA